MATQRMTFKEMLNVSGVILLVLWAVLIGTFVIAYITGYDLKQFGIHPRSVGGLLGIPLSPFLHANTAHLLANMTALFILGLVLMLLEHRNALWIVVGIVLLGGLGTWIIGRSGSVHVGASGVVFGMMGYLIAAGWYKRQAPYVIAALLVLFFYGSALFGMLPTVTGVSWEGHLCGFLAGVAEARWAKKPA